MLRLVSVVCVVLAFAGCRPNGTANAKDRPIELLVASEPETLDPRYAVDAVSHRITRLVHVGLTRLDPDTLEPRPAVAESLTFTDPQTLAVTLRADARFHSGAPLRAHDVAETYRAVLDPKIAARTARIIEPIASVDETGERTLTIHLKRPHATLLTDLELPIMRADEARGAPRPDGKLDGLGPYHVAQVTPGQVILEPSSTLDHARASLTIRTVRDENARALRMIAQRADVAVNVFSPTLIPALANERGLAVTRRPGANVTYLLLRADRAPFDRLEARRAASLAIDRSTLTNALFGGSATPATGALPPALWAYTAPPPLPFDREGAARDVATLGRLSFTLLTTPDRVRLSVARTIAQQLRDANASVEVVSLELGTLLARLTSGDFDAAILNMPEVTEPNVLKLFLHSSSIPPAAVNRGRVRDPEIDRALDEGASTTDLAARKAAYTRLETRLRETHLFVPLWYEDQVSITTPRTGSFRPSAEGRWLALSQIP